MATESTETFGHEDRERIYNHLKTHGPTRADELAGELDLDPSGIRSHVAILKRDGLVYEHEDVIAVGFDPDEVEDVEDTYTEDDVEITIRRATQSDLDGLVDAIREVTDDRTYIVAESVADLIDYENLVVFHDALESRMVFVAVADDDVVGWAHVQSPESEKLHHTAELTVGVRKECRGHRIGSHLLKHAIGWAEREGYEKLYNSVPSSNQNAIDFLEEHDWEVEAVREDHYHIGDEYLDEVMLSYWV